MLEPEALEHVASFGERRARRTEISATSTPERLEGDLAAAVLEPTHPGGSFALSLSRPR